MRDRDKDRETERGACGVALQTDDRRVEIEIWIVE
ncbi:unnamed protein product [Camellia sinensis]